MTEEVLVSNPFGTEESRWQTCSPGGHPAPAEPLLVEGISTLLLALNVTILPHLIQKPRLGMGFQTDFQSLQNKEVLDSLTGPEHHSQPTSGAGWEECSDQTRCSNPLHISNNKSRIR